MAYTEQLSDFEAEFQGLMDTARELSRLVMKDTTSLRDGQETFFEIAIGQILHGDIDGFARGSAMEYFGHLLYHLSGLIPLEDRRNMRASLPIEQYYDKHSIPSPFSKPPGSFAEIDQEDGRLVWWLSVEDWRQEWESDPYGTIPDISLFQREIGQPHG